MKTGKGIIFSLITGGMELCWMYGWASFITIAITDTPLSFFGATGAFALAAILTTITSGKGWRIIQIGGVHLLGFAVTVLGIFHSIYYPSYLFLSGDWIYALFHQLRTPQEWVVFALVLVWIILFWIGGITLAGRQKVYHTVCARFDIGLAAFFCLFLAKLVLFDKGGIRVADPWSSTLVFPFILFSLFAIGMTRAETGTQKMFLPGYRSIGIIASFLTIVVLSAGTIVLFFLPLLTAAAHTGYGLLKGGAEFALPVIERILRFAFMGRGMREEPAGASSKSGEPDLSFTMNDGPWMQFVDAVIKWGIQGLVVLLLVAGCCLMLFFLIRWLLSRSRYIEKEITETYKIGPWLSRLRSVLVLIWRKMMLFIKGYRTGAECYGALLVWGEHSGLTCLIQETPLEFGARLNKCFPRLQTEIDVIVSAFNKEVYGEVRTSSEGMRRMTTALRSLRNPRHWFQRLKTRFINPGCI